MHDVIRQLSILSLSANWYLQQFAFGFAMLFNLPTITWFNWAEIEIIISFFDLKRGINSNSSTEWVGFSIFEVNYDFSNLFEFNSPYWCLYWFIFSGRIWITMAWFYCFIYSNIQNLLRRICWKFCMIYSEIIQRSILNFLKYKNELS